MKTITNIIWPLINAILLIYVFFHLDTRSDRFGRGVYALIMLSIIMNLLVKYLVLKPAKKICVTTILVSAEKLYWCVQKI